MKLIPFNQIILKSALNPDDLSRTLITRLVESAENDFSRTNQHKPYTGTVSPNGFRIWRKIFYASPARTEIIGVVTQLDRGSAINVRFELNTFGIIFNGFMMLLAVVSFPAVALVIFSGEDPLLSFIPFGLLLITVLITIIPFKYEQRVATKILLEITKGEIEEDRS